MEILFLLVGLLFAGLGAYMVFDHVRFMNMALETMGTVTGYRKSAGSKGSVYYKPVVKSYIGSSAEFTSAYGSSSPKYQIGQQVPVLYVQGKEPRLKSKAPYIGGLILFVFGAIFCMVFVRVFYFSYWHLGVSALVLLTIAFQARQMLKSKGIDSLDELKDKFQEFREESSKEDGPVIRDLSELEEVTVKQKKTQKWIGPVFALAGIGAIALGIYLGLARADFLEHAVPSVGKVVDFRESYSDDSYTYYPIVEYSPRGTYESFTFEHDVGSNPPSYRTGEMVNVLHLPDNFNEAIIDEGIFNWTGPAIALLIGIVFAWAGGWVTYLAYKS